VKGEEGAKSLIKVEASTSRKTAAWEGGPPPPGGKDERPLNRGESRRWSGETTGESKLGEKKGEVAAAGEKGGKK